MKGTIIAAMIAAAVAASAATVFALKKHTTRDWTRPATVTTCRKADAAAQTRTKMTISVSATHRKKLPTQKRLRRTARKPQRTPPLHPAAVQMVSALRFDDDAADQPAQLHMPEADEDSDTDETEKED
ncbi:MAG: hypothetical protein ACLUOF_03590 [Ruminococcus sp.]